MTDFPISTLHGDDSLLIESVALSEIAERFGTPTYVYSRQALTDAYHAYEQALAGRRATICYAVKANSNLGILDAFARLGAGFDIVSGGELKRVLAAGGDPAKVVFSGVGKTVDEIRLALDACIGCFNIESPEELDRLDTTARAMGKTAPIAFRVNPDVDPKTHPYISTGLKANKFGVAYSDARALYRRAATMDGIAVCGIASHIGSQLLDPAPVAEAAERVLALVKQLNADGIELDHIDIGGGMGIRYDDEILPGATRFLAPVLEVLAGRPEALHLEPGRSLIGNAGLLLTRVEFLKHGEEKHFAIVDAAMNDLARPALYDAYHAVVPVQRSDTPAQTYDVVGPICESGDFLARDRQLAVRAGDLLAILSAGAYGMTMASNYNTRPRAAEVMVDGEVCYAIRERERVEDLYANEHRLP
ncbi:diaminopimelate decarboxylase [Nitrogeniibacter mangrovi]|uniref:Diaminopimelate decarboxylase n=1 Tax=Nitrogeniibacter mangrovi TaxID=2016596 RepID=A0A6C1AZJ9_9RHOO|nr:diaminopimelate decarboxylase [Nitrogeniibacter mangrovi]QID16782.1 diaminopimelate decarboxylase [Nitrogeniibacter mangrovi]